MNNTGKSLIREDNDVTHRVIAIAVTRTYRKRMDGSRREEQDIVMHCKDCQFDVGGVGVGWGGVPVG